MTDAPADLYPYSGQGSSAAILALLYPPPAMPVSGGALKGVAPGLPYTTTGVLEELPTFENGGVVTETTTVYLDASGAITTTETEVTTEVTQLAVTYRWNPNLTWSDGQPVTAEDSLFAYQVARASATTAETVRRLELTAHYEVLDSHTTRAYLPPGFRPSDYLLTAWLPLPRHALSDLSLEQVREQLAWSPLSYGPYTLASADSGEVVLSRRPDVPTSYPEQIVFRFFSDLAALRTELLAERLDIGITDAFAPEQWPFLNRDQEQGALQVFSTPGPVWEHLNINLDRPPFDDPRVRRALALGTDRARWAAELFGGHAEPMDSWIVSDSWAYAGEELTRYPYDPQQAAQLLNEAGLIDSDSDGVREIEPGIPFSATLLTSSDTALRKEIARLLQEDLQTLGISLTIERLPMGQLYRSEGPLFRREFTLALFGWLRSPDPAGAVLWGCAAVPGTHNNLTGNNFAGWCNLDADQALRKATSTLDREQRRTAYKTHQRLFSEDLPVIPLFARPVVVLALPDVRGLQPDAFAPLVWNIADWRRNKR